MVHIPLMLQLNLLGLGHQSYLLVHDLLLNLLSRSGHSRLWFRLLRLSQLDLELPLILWILLDPEHQ